MDDKTDKSRSEIGRLLGAKVLNLRQKMGLSQDQLADKTGVTRSYLGEVERGTANPTLSLMQKLSTALEISLSDLIASLEDEPVRLEKATVLIADVAKGQTRLRRVMSGYELLATRELSEAKSMLDRQEVHLIIGGLHFSDGRIFDFLRMVKANPETRHIPFICFRELPVGVLPPFIHEAVEVCARALGAIAVIESDQFVTTTNPDAELRAALEQHVTRDKRVRT